MILARGCGGMNRGPSILQTLISIAVVGSSTATSTTMSRSNLRPFFINALRGASCHDPVLSSARPCVLASKPIVLGERWITMGTRMMMAADGGADGEAGGGKKKGGGGGGGGGGGNKKKGKAVVEEEELSLEALSAKEKELRLDRLSKVKAMEDEGRTAFAITYPITATVDSINKQ